MPLNKETKLNAKSFYTYILNIYDLVWSGLMTYQP